MEGWDWQTKGNTYTVVTRVKNANIFGPTEPFS
jgi:hypothetical protein